MPLREFDSEDNASGIVIFEESVLLEELSSSVFVSIFFGVVKKI